jgi:hypothetical protein
MRRRTLLKLGTVSAATLLVAGGAAVLWQPGVAHGRLTAAGRSVFAGVAPAFLDGTLPATGALRQAALLGLLSRLDEMVQGFAPAVQEELSQLLGLLSTALGRRTLAGLQADWAQASLAEVQAALKSMRFSRLALRQQSYHALHDMVGAAYFSDESTWGVLGYPGPMKI